MTYTFDFDDNYDVNDKDKSAREAVNNLNEVCKRTKACWQKLANETTRNEMNGKIFDALDEILKKDSGAELFFFATPPFSTKVMARRLCAALRLVAETLYEEGIDEGIDDYTTDIYHETKWAAHCPKSGMRQSLATHNNINTAAINRIRVLVFNLRNLVVSKMRKSKK